MTSTNKHAGLEGILQMLSHTGACAVVADRSSIILGITPKFQALTNNHAVGLPLGNVFGNIPAEFPSGDSNEVQLTLRSSGRQISVWLVNFDLDGAITVLIVSNGAESREGIIAEHALNVSASEDLIFQFDAEGKIFSVSGNVERITGYKADEFNSGRIHPLDIIHSDDRPAIENEFRNIFATHKSAESSECRLIKKNGEVEYFLKSWYAVFDIKGTFSGIVSIDKNITADKELHERLELFHSAFQQSTDAIVITGIDGRIIDVNGTFTEIYGFSRAEAVGKSTSLIQSRYSTPDFYRDMWKSLEKDNQWRGEILNRRKDGTEIPVWLSITPIYLGNRKIGYMGIESDMSEQKNLEQQIIQTEKLATIGQLSAGIAHEIGTPLNIISGNAELVLLDMESSDHGRRELETIIEQTKRISVLMRQLLDFARPKVLSLRSTDVNDVLIDVLDFVRLQFKKGGIEIVSKLEESLPNVYGDPALLYQVFLNVIMNSFQSMSRRGTLTVRTRPVQSAEREMIEIEISDTGEGIRPENMEKIFTPFFTTKAPGKGTGLGLAVTRRIVQEHSGRINIISTHGEGTTVSIFFNAFRQKSTAQ